MPDDASPRVSTRVSPGPPPSPPPSNPPSPPLPPRRITFSRGQHHLLRHLTRAASPSAGGSTTFKAPYKGRITFSRGQHHLYGTLQGLHHLQQGQRQQCRRANDADHVGRGAVLQLPQAVKEGEAEGGGEGSTRRSEALHVHLEGGEGGEEGGGGCVRWTFSQALREGREGRRERGGGGLIYNKAGS